MLEPAEQVRDGPVLAKPSLRERLRPHLKMLTGAVASVAAIGAVASGLLGYWSVWKTVSTEVLYRQAAPPTPRLAPALSIVVLPFAFLGNSDEQYFSDAVESALIADLARIRGSVVISQSTSQTFKGATDVRRLSSDLGVRYALEGQINKLGEKLRINAQLSDTEKGLVVWSDRFEGGAKDVAEVQSEIVTRLARALNIELIQADAARIARHKQEKPGVLELTTLGWSMYLRPRSRENVLAAQSYFRRAYEIDEKSSDALAGLAVMTAVSVTLHWSSDPKRDTTEVIKLADAALALDPNSAAAYFSRGWVFKVTAPANALSQFQAALEINPNFPDGTRQLAETYLWAGRPVEAIAATEQFLKLSPRDPNLGIALWVQGYSLLLLGDTEKAIPLLENAVLRNGSFSGTHTLLAAAYALAGREADARASLAEAQRLSPTLTSVTAYHRDRTPEFRALCEATVNKGLRQAGLP